MLTCTVWLIFVTSSARTLSISQRRIYYYPVLIKINKFAVYLNDLTYDVMVTLRQRHVPDVIKAELYEELLHSELNLLLSIMEAWDSLYYNRSHRYYQGVKRMIKKIGTAFTMHNEALPVRVGYAQEVYGELRLLKEMLIPDEYIRRIGIYGFFIMYAVNDFHDFIEKHYHETNKIRWSRWNEYRVTTTQKIPRTRKPHDPDYSTSNESASAMSFSLSSFSYVHFSSYEDSNETEELRKINVKIPEELYRNLTRENYPSYEMEGENYSENGISYRVKRKTRRKIRKLGTRKPRVVRNRGGIRNSRVKKNETMIRRRRTKRPK
uniref:Uncharacterized protein n=1 Tax=Clastoptera arizonana TaxID=38151 RepID=A0A1B6DZV3_9HEMI